MGICTTCCSRCLDRHCSCDERKTKQVLQHEYELIYLGPEFDIATQMALLISMTYLVLLYSTSMPIMYLVGAVFCAFCYMVQKCLFLRLYRSPPKYGIQLVQGALKVMEWSILLHLFISVYMISNPDIFSL
jgi:hypothetical protein